MSKVIRKSSLITVLLFLMVVGALGLGWAGDTRADDSTPASDVVRTTGAQALELRGSDDLPKVPSDHDGMFAAVEKEGVEIGNIGGTTLFRFDDWERGVSCYRQGLGNGNNGNTMSCAPMAPKVYELRQTGMRF